MASSPHYSGARLQALEEIADFLPHFGAAREAAPAGANQTDQFVALIDRQNEIFRRRDRRRDRCDSRVNASTSASISRAQDCVLEIIPGIERQQRLGSSSGAGIEGNDSFVWSAVEEERHTDGNHQAFPLCVRRWKSDNRTRRGTRLYFVPAAEKDGAGVARAQKLATPGFDQVGMLGTQFCATQFAALHVCVAPAQTGGGLPKAFSNPGYDTSSHSFRRTTSAHAVALRSAKFAERHKARRTCRFIRPLRSQAVQVGTAVIVRHPQPWP